MASFLVAALLLAVAGVGTLVWLSGRKDAPITLVHEGSPQATILWWARRDSPVPAFAASELAAYLHEMSGARLRVVEGEVDEARRIAGLDSAILIQPGKGPSRSGDTTRGETASFPADVLATAAKRVQGLQQDGFAVATLGDRIALAGSGDRGTLYAAYELLERLGVRFFAPDFDFYEGHAEHVPRATTVQAPRLDLAEEPSFRYRRKFVEEGWSHTPATLERLVAWMAKARLNVLVYPYDYLGYGFTRWDDSRQHLIPELRKRGISLDVGGHGYNSFLPEGRYRAKHPDWFEEGANVFDVTNEEAVVTYVANVVRYLKQRPEIDVFHAWPPDSAKWPRSAIRRFGSIPNAQAFVTRRLTEAVGAEVPRVRVETLAYRPAPQPPDPEYIEDESNLVDLAPHDRSYAEPIFADGEPKNVLYDDLVKEWNAVFAGDLGVYEYYRKYRWHSLPVVVTGLIGREIPYYRSTGAVALGTFSEPADWITYELTHLLVAALSWDTALDPEAFVAGYLRDRYGPAAPEMEPYLRLVEDAGRVIFDRPKGNYSDVDVLSRARNDYAGARRALDAAMSAARTEAASFLLGRLLDNIEFAIADTDISIHAAQGDLAAAADARSRTEALVEKHRLDGIILQNHYAMQRYGKAVSYGDLRSVFEMYRRAW